MWGSGRWVISFFELQLVSFLSLIHPCIVEIPFSDVSWSSPSSEVWGSTLDYWPSQGWHSSAARQPSHHAAQLLCNNTCTVISLLVALQNPSASRSQRCAGRCWGEKEEGERQTGSSSIILGGTNTCEMIPVELRSPVSGSGHS